jgi:hypothetical protein
LLYYIIIVAWWLKAAIVHQETAIARQWRGKAVSVEMNQHATTEEVLEAVSAMLSVKRLYNKNL